MPSCYESHFRVRDLLVHYNFLAMDDAKFAESLPPVVGAITPFAPSAEPAIDLSQKCWKPTLEEP